MRFALIQNASGTRTRIQAKPDKHKLIPDLKNVSADLERRRHGLHRQVLLQDEEVPHELTVHKFKTGI